MSNFTYLHLHTRFSRSGGPAAPAEWCRRAAELGYSAIGFTDRSPLAGLPSAHKAAGEAGLKPLYGIEVDLMLPTEAGRKAELILQPALIFARSHEGMVNLAAIASDVYSGWLGSEHALAWEILATNTTGLLVILLGGDEAGALTPIATAQAKRLAAWSKLVKSAFSDAAFVGIPHSGRPGDNALAGQVASVAGTLDLPALATPTARYLRPEDAPSYEALKVARRRAGWPREDASSSSTASVAADRPGHDYLRSPEDAAALYTQWPQAVENIARVVEMCGLTEAEWPFYVETSHANNDFLKELAEKRLLAALSIDILPSDISERLTLKLIRSAHSKARGPHSPPWRIWPRIAGRRMVRCQLALPPAPPAVPCWLMRWVSLPPLPRQGDLQPIARFLPGRRGARHSPRGADRVPIERIRSRQSSLRGVCPNYHTNPGGAGSRKRARHLRRRSQNDCPCHPGSGLGCAFPRARAKR